MLLNIAVQFNLPISDIPFENESPSILFVLTVMKIEGILQLLFMGININLINFGVGSFFINFYNFYGIFQCYVIKVCNTNYFSDKMLIPKSEKCNMQIKGSIVNENKSVPNGQPCLIPWLIGKFLLRKPFISKLDEAV